jgi:hypothetical protein
MEKNEALSVNCNINCGALIKLRLESRGAGK